MNLKKLSDPFPVSDIEFRLDQVGETNNKIWGRCVAYIQARAVMDRLDEVVGSDNWRVSYDVLDKGVLCHLSIKIGGEWITKSDGAEQTDIEAFKGGISGALKRAGSVWGIARYLYKLDSSFITIVEKNAPGAQYAKTKDGKVFYWAPPQLPDWALPIDSNPKEQLMTGILKRSEETYVNTTRPAIVAEVMGEADRIGADKKELIDMVAYKFGPDTNLKTMSVSQIAEFKEYLMTFPTHTSPLSKEYKQIQKEK